MNKRAIGIAHMQCWISYENALLQFANSRIYDALFDYDTGIWKQNSDYVLNLYNYYTKTET